MNGVRSVDDVLQGYRATGHFNPERWLIVNHQGEEIGCLILTDYPEHATWELIYIGLLSAVRGQGRGVKIISHALWLSGQASRNRLVLAVDAANEPALRMYAAAGFRAWDRTSVYIRVLGAPKRNAACKIRHGESRDASGRRRPPIPCFPGTERQ